MPDPQQYTVGWICALTTEFVAARTFFDEEHEKLQNVDANDNNNYALGRIGPHNVVMAVLPKFEYGTSSAATVARDMLRTFPNVRFGLMVGIGGGAPSPEHDIRLGDIVVSARDSGTGGVLQYDYGRTIQRRKFQQTGALNQPPQLLLTAVSSLEADYELKGHRLNTAVASILEAKPRLQNKYSRPQTNSDRLYRSDVVHRSPAEGCDISCGNDPANLVERCTRGEDEDDPAIHYGLIASANQVMKDAKIRDKLAAEKGVLCFEMEAAGLMNHFPCLVIRGICDYSDSHKYSAWQGFAAMMAASYAKDLLLQIAPSRVEAERPIREQLDAIERNIGNVVQTSRETRSVVETVKSSQQDKEIREWLHPPDASTNLNNARDLRQQGTGQRFLDSAPFREWERGSRQHLWLHGISGCGKTILSSTIIDHLESKSDHVVLKFFFDFNDIAKQTVDGMARSLLFQLYRFGKSQIDGLFQAHQDGKNQPDTKALLETMSTILRAQNKVYIVLDAMDECSMRKGLLTWLEVFVGQTEPKQVKMMLTGRPEAEFLSNMPTFVGEENCISLDKSCINTDIRSYITTRLQQPEFKRWASHPDMQRKILGEVGEKANGMFRLAACQLDTLEECIDLDGINQALRNLPQNLGEMYDRTMRSIPAMFKKKAQQLLQFLIHVERPLTLKEAVDIVAVQTDKEWEYFKIADRMPDERDILRLCPSLISIVSTSRWRGESRKELHLAHLSVKEYLLERSGLDKNVFDEKADVTITRTCLLYLGGVSREIRGKNVSINDTFFFAELAAESWIRHAAAGEDSEDVAKLNVDFLTRDTTFSLWKSLYHEEEYLYRRRRYFKASCLYYACFGGLKKCVQDLLHRDLDVNAEGGYYGNALRAASSEGHVEIVQLLLENGADANAEGGFYGNALRAASFEGHTEVVQLLLEVGASRETHALSVTRNLYTTQTTESTAKRGHSPSYGSDSKRRKT